jgi:hypothetical protein
MKKPADRSTFGAFVVLGLEEQLAAPDGTVRAEILERLECELERARAQVMASRCGTSTQQRDAFLFVECLSAARRVVERSSSFENAPTHAANTSRS